VSHGQKAEAVERSVSRDLKDVYFAENKILKTLPNMAKAAQIEGPQGRLG
jgi:ferritin-like metal-binding protein YciE